MGVATAGARNSRAARIAATDPAGAVAATLALSRDRAVGALLDARAQPPTENEPTLDPAIVVCLTRIHTLSAEAEDELPLTVEESLDAAVEYLRRAVVEALQIADPSWAIWVWTRTPAEDGLSLLTMAVEGAGMGELVEAESRQDKRILPRVQVREAPAKEQGRLFARAGTRNDLPAPMLPLFPKSAPEKRVAILDLMDASGVPVMARGRGVPLSARLLVRAMATVRPEDRGRELVRLAITADELRRALFGERWRARQWKQLQDALLHARDYTIHDGSGLWFPLALRRMPDQWHPTDEVILDVAFPPKSTSGPIVDLPEMETLSRQSAARWRAYIAAMTLAWRPGVTRVRTRYRRHAWSRDAGRYLILTDEDRHRLAFGAGDRKHRTRTEIDRPFIGLPGLRVIDMQRTNVETGETGWIVVPEAAARAIDAGEKTDPTREKTDPTREKTDPTRERSRKKHQ